MRSVIKSNKTIKIFVDCLYYPSRYFNKSRYVTKIKIYAYFFNRNIG